MNRAYAFLCFAWYLYITKVTRLDDICGVTFLCILAWLMYFFIKYPWLSCIVVILVLPNHSLLMKINYLCDFTYYEIYPNGFLI